MAKKEKEINLDDLEQEIEDSEPEEKIEEIEEFSLDEVSEADEISEVFEEELEPPEEEVIQEIITDPIVPDNTESSLEKASMVDSSANHNLPVVVKSPTSSLTSTVITEQ